MVCLVAIMTNKQYPNYIIDGWCQDVIDAAMLGLDLDAAIQVLQRAQQAPATGWRFGNYSSFHKRFQLFLSFGCIGGFAQHFQDYEPSFILQRFVVPTHFKCVELSRPGSFLIHAHRHALHVDEPPWWRQSDYSAVRRMARSMMVCINLYLLLIISLFLSDNAHYLSLNNAIDISGTCHSSCWDLWTQRWRPRVSVASFSTLMLLHNLAPIISLC